MQIEYNKSLKEHNTFGIDVKANQFLSVSSEKELIEILKQHNNQSLFILGGGSNMLLTQDIEALVLHINLKGIRIVEETESNVKLKVMAGENWHEFVCYCIEHDYGGVENMSLIPGNVGTAPIQNIGAYGVELKDVFVSCDTVSMDGTVNKTFTKEECNFGYRNSIFKNEAKGEFIITSVTFNLTKSNHKLSTSYGVIQQELDENKISNPTIKDVSQAVIAIRQSKLPDPKELGNSGSFFKNPIVDKTKFERFSKNFPEAPFYKISDTEWKIPAGWLIEQAGFKGKRYGDAGIHKKQALVLVNYGDATGKEIWDLALKIKDEVFKKFGIQIIPEVNII